MKKSSFFIGFIFFMTINLSLISQNHIEKETLLNTNFSYQISLIDKKTYEKLENISLQLVKDNNTIKNSDSNSLKIHVKDSVLIFYNIIIDDQRQKIHIPLGRFFETPFYLVELNLYESSEYILINTLNGHIDKFSGFPIVSKDGNYVFVYNYSNSGISDNIIQLLGIKNDILYSLYKIVSDKYQIIDAKWVKENILAIFLNISANQNNPFYAYVLISITG